MYPAFLASSSDMNFPLLVLPYQRPPLWYTPLSRLTQTIPCDLAEVIWGSLAAGVAAAIFGVLAGAAVFAEAVVATGVAAGAAVLAGAAVGVEVLAGAAMSDFALFLVFFDADDEVVAGVEAAAVSLAAGAVAASLLIAFDFFRLFLLVEAEESLAI